MSASSRALDFQTVRSAFSETVCGS